MFNVNLSESDVKAIRALTDELIARYDSVEDPEFVADAAIYAHELPRDLRLQLNHFRLTEPDALCVISGYPIDDRRIGPTPPHWRDCVGSKTALPEEFFFYLCACLLGDPIAWATQQDGRLLHDVMPIEAHKHEQLGSGSEQLLTWHTEDAFHPLRTDYVGLMCMRNHDGIETTAASVDDIRIEPDLAEVMRQERFPIRPDRSHLPHNRAGGEDTDPETKKLLERSYEWIMGLEEDPKPIAMLFGHPDKPYLRLDPYFMHVPEDDPEAAAALEAITKEIDASIGGVVLKAGDVLFLDNYRAVHGRKAFTARFDGTDRWLKRLNIARDLRKSRAARRTADSRTIF
ncbi:clavaminate synthase family protein [Sphaerisporangium rubeum]|uniref:Fe(II)/alpha-ketoglutarate-dependent arginine beta-hydroxylase n=1 Tax=Sphaerisporangium rubeum TaxID=321317 RepID=A0A7X0M8F7_9ACTN|nr:guanitoxin biosynthesis L-enduracididine beta-hydroxylase GntD [Sphaerisporangium rubeum]MBB6475803.1 Fe(II)/alpha-ketoglutarate-dependent arginine beta-hydroxylase [Sphaerisporangium rubeum]